MTSFFLSYSRGDDKTFARQLHADLTMAGFDVGSDRACLPARRCAFDQEIRDAIAVRDRLLLVAVGGCH